MDYMVRTEVFEGPFDLLLHLIARQQVDIWQVSLSSITEDYLGEIRRMRELNLEVATEFLVVAATLLELKAARLLPSPDGEQDAFLPRRAGGQDLLERIAPNLLTGVRPEDLARLAAGAFTPTPVPQVSTDHIAPARLTVSEAVAELAGRLRGQGETTFEALLSRNVPPIEVVINLLALLELYKRSLIELEQTATFGAITVRWTGHAGAETDDLMVEEPA